MLFLDPREVASTLVVRCLSDNTIMKSANWASSQTLYNHYLCLLPDSASSQISQSVQSVLLPFE